MAESGDLWELGMVHWQTNVGNVEVIRLEQTNVHQHLVGLTIGMHSQIINIAEDTMQVNNLQNMGKLLNIELAFLFKLYVSRGIFKRGESYNWTANPRFVPLLWMWTCARLRLRFLLPRWKLPKTHKFTISPRQLFTFVLVSNSILNFDNFHCLFCSNIQIAFALHHQLHISRQTDRQRLVVEQLLETIPKQLLALLKYGDERRKLKPPPNWVTWKVS